MEKQEEHPLVASLTPKTRVRSAWARSVWTLVVALAAVVSFTSWRQRDALQRYWLLKSSLAGTVINTPVVRHYNLTVGFKWANYDGGRWRPFFVCNGESPCPTLTAKEGDQVEIHVVNDLGAQLSIHWSGMAHKRMGFWNDGTGGLNQWPILPRGNWTSKFDTTGHFGLNWYADHTGAGVADGVYGMIYTAPSPSRSRPYSRITQDAADLALIQEAEDNVRHVSLWNSDFRTVAWKVDRMKATGKGLSCYKSILVNGKGRVMCRNPRYSTIDGQELDEAGCVVPEGQRPDACRPSEADFEIIETHGQKYIMLNLLNVGFEHALKWSIDDHSFWVVADDAGFLEPQKVDVLYITNGARYTVLIELDQPAADYAIRLASTSKLQNLEGFALLRYPAKRYPMLGVPMALPETDDSTKICLNADSSVPKTCHELAHDSLRPFPANKPDKKSDLTLLWTAGSQQNKYMDHVTEYFVNEKPWQLFQAAMEPVLFTSDAQSVEKPVQNGLPVGTVVDLIVQNTLNETIPMYKHGSPTYRLGSASYEKFEWSSVADVLKHDKDILNVDNPPLGVVHDLPPLGWLAIRWKVELQGATMFHAVKLKYFALGMAAPLLEGIEQSMLSKIPSYAKNQPHVAFEPANDGVFG